MLFRELLLSDLTVVDCRLLDELLCGLTVVLLLLSEELCDLTVALRLLDELR